jgi:hypothetical protein
MYAYSKTSFFSRLYYFTSSVNNVGPSFWGLLGSEKFPFGNNHSHFRSKAGTGPWES